MRRIATAFLLVALFYAAPQETLAQNREVRGTVIDATNGEPLIGVNIRVEGTSTGATTNMDGEYNLQVPGPDAVLVFSYVGYVTQSITVGDQRVINVTMQEDAQLLDDVIVVGYGTQRRSDVTSSVGIVNVDDANVGLVTSADDLLQGRVAGVQVLENNGEPGGGVNIRIRGGTSISASNDPLYVIDGVPIDNANAVGGVDFGGATAAPGRNPLNLINPNDIESISVLKDAAATAIYGSRGANGVVLITTKSGLAGRVTVDYEGRVSAASAANTLDLVSADQYRSFIQEQVAARVLGYDDKGALIDENSNGVADIIDGLGSANSNFQDAVLRDAISHQHNLSFAGGTQTTQYRASLSYLDQEGVIISSGIERLTARLNANNTSLNGKLRIGLNLTSALASNDYVAYENTAGFEGGLFTNVYDFNPTFPITTGSDVNPYYEIPGQRSIRNPVALAEQIADNEESTRTLGNVSVELDLLEGLTGQINFGGDRTVSRRQAYFPRANPVGAEFNGRAIQLDGTRTSVTLASYLTYRRASGIHNYDLLGGYEFNEFNAENFRVEARDFVTDFTGPFALNSGVVTQSGTNSFKERSRLISFFSRLNYNLQEKYYLSGSLRYDGSSRFGSDNKWAIFPAISASWRLSQEPFLQDNAVINDLRLRAGYGVVGNQAIPNYLSLQTLRADAAGRAVLGGQVFSGYAPARLANPGLRWEEKQEVTVGLDYTILDSRVFGSLEFYRNTTDNLLLEISLPQPNPVPTFVDNLGSIRNMGIDFSLDGFVFEKRESSFQVGLTLNTNSNEILNLGGRDRIFTGTVSGRGQSGQNALLLTPGQPFPVFYAFEFVGIENGDQIFNDYEDTDGDGFGDNLVGTTTSPTDEDRQIVGDPRADFSYGLRLKGTYKQFGLSMFFRGEQGRELFNNTALIFETKSAAAQGRGFLADALDNEDATREAPVFSSRWIEDASFFRLDNITLDYTLPANQISSMLRSTRIFFSVDNVFVLTPYSGYDPEVNTNAQVGLIPATGIDYTNYPKPRTLTLGLQIGF